MHISDATAHSQPDLALATNTHSAYYYMSRLLCINKSIHHPFSSLFPLALKLLF
jgi:hypothetical protein